MKNINKTELIHNIFDRHLGTRIRVLESNYLTHTGNIDICFNNIDHMKSKIFQENKRYKKDL